MNRLIQFVLLGKKKAKESKPWEEMERPDYTNYEVPTIDVQPTLEYVTIERPIGYSGTETPTINVELSLTYSQAV